MQARMEVNKPPVMIRRQSGLTLLEIMVTVVILSLGLLGLAGLQMTGLKNNRNAYYNSIAGQAVQNIAERLRVDAVTRDAITALAPKNLTGNNAQCASDVADTFDNRVMCIASNLPDGQARITELSATPKMLYLAMRWTDLQLDGANGWGVDTATNKATSACGVAAANTSCYYTVFRP
jgi:type IV pilus assembly protein PilV